MTNSRAVYTAKANRGPKFVVIHLRGTRVLTMITEGQTELMSFHSHTLIY